MTTHRLRGACPALAALALLGGCASVPENAGLAAVNERVAPATGQTLIQRRDAESDAAARAEVARLLARPLSADDVVRVALLNNFELQSALADLGIARAELMQASLVPNPVFHGEWKWEHGEGRPLVDIGLMQPIQGLLTLPARKRAASASFDLRKIEVADAVFGLVRETRVAVVELQAEKARCALLEEVAGSASASLDVARRLHAAGNLTDRDLDRRQAMEAEARLALAESEEAVAMRVEALNQVMGVFGDDTRWRLADDLTEPERSPPDTAGIERAAIEASLSLAAARARLETAAERVGIENTQSLFRHLELGPVHEHKGGEREYGFGLGFELPLFDVGQGQRAAAQAMFIKRSAEYRATALAVRSAARSAALRLSAADDKARYTREVLAPLAQRQFAGKVLEYNAMQIGVFRLLSAFDAQTAMKRRLIDATRDYWLALIDIGALHAGHTPASGTMTAGSTAAMPMAGGSDGGH